MNINIDIYADLQQRQAKLLQSKIYDSLNNELELYIDSINYSLEDEKKKLENINMLNYKKLLETKVNIIKLSEVNPDIIKPKVNKELKIRLEQLYKQYEKVVEEYNSDCYEAYELRGNIKYIQSLISDESKQIKKFDETLNNCFYKPELFELKEYKLKVFNYKDKYQVIKGGVLDEEFNIR